jgi:hypothetical protein
MIPFVFFNLVSIGIGFALGFCFFYGLYGEEIRAFQRGKCGYIKYDKKKGLQFVEQKPKVVE